MDAVWLVLPALVLEGHLSWPQAGLCVSADGAGTCPASLSAPLPLLSKAVFTPSG